VRCLLWPESYETGREGKPRRMSFKMMDDEIGRTVGEEIVVTLE
jgi:hypothetical protein